MHNTWSRQSLCAVLLAVALAWLILSSPWLGGQVTIPYDAKAHFHAQLQFLANALHSGQSPFWTPNVFAGSPQIADPQSLIFSPAILLAYFSADPTFTMVDAYVLSLLGCGALAIVFFFRDRAWHPIGAMVAALAFAFGASAAWRIQHIGQVESFAFFGISLWLLTRAVRRQSRLWGFATGISAGTMVMTPDQVALLASYILVAVAIAEAFRGNSLRTLWRVAPVLGITLVTTLLVASVPLLLTYLFVEASNRPVLALAEAAHGSLHPASLLTGIVGDLYGALDPKLEYWGPYSMSWDPRELTLSQNMSQLYVGAVPAVLALTIGLVRRLAWASEIRVFTAALLAMIVYALGAFTPLFGLIYATVPGVDLFRRPADATFLIGGLLSIVGGYLVHRVASASVPRASRLQSVIEIGIICCAFAAGLAIAGRSNHLADVVKPITTAAVFTVTAAGLLWFVGRFSNKHALACLTIATAFVTCDLGLNNGPNESTALSAGQFDVLRPDCADETIQFLKARLKPQPNSSRRDRVELVGMGFAWPNLGLVHGFDHVLGYNPLRLEVATKAIGAGDTIAGWDQRWFTPLFPSYRSLLADLLGLRYIVSPIPIEQVDRSLRPGDLQQIARTKDAYIYENPRALPRVMFVADWMDADFDALVADGKWPAFDPRKTVLLEKAHVQVGKKHAMLSHASLDTGTKVTGTATISRFENTIVDVDVSAPTAGFLVMNGAWHPWWRATIDGRPTDVLKANVMFRAVEVPAGSHLVQFEFQPFHGATLDIQSMLTTIFAAHRKPLFETGGKMSLLHPQF